MQIDIIFQVAVIIFSAVIHEVSHGYAALFLGDPTAKYEGRLTLNPFKHLDLFGSVIVPILTSFAGLIFGWAKPVPYNPYNLKKERWGEALVALAGPLSNVLIAFLFSIAIRLQNFIGVGENFIELASVVVYLNLILAIFNLIPIPPLDGSKILFSILPERARAIRVELERYGLFILLFVILFLPNFIIPILSFLFHFFTGLKLF